MSESNAQGAKGTKRVHDQTHLRTACPWGLHALLRWMWLDMRLDLGFCLQAPGCGHAHAHYRALTLRRRIGDGQRSFSTRTNMRTNGPLQQ